MAIMIDRDKLLIEIAAKQSLLKQGPEELIGGRIYWQISGLDLAAQLTQGMGVEAEPVRHGRWINKQGGFLEICECSVCHNKYPTAGGAPCYCPSCGAKMASASSAVTGKELSNYRNFLAQQSVNALAEASSKDNAVCGVTETSCTRCNPGPCGSRREGGDHDGK